MEDNKSVPQAGQTDTDAPCGRGRRTAVSHARHHAGAWTRRFPEPYEIKEIFIDQPDLCELTYQDRIDNLGRYGIGKRH
jgi:hypothetical protein